MRFKSPLLAKHRAKSKVNATGRSNTDRFVRLPHMLLNSNAYRALSPNARALLIELTSIENGRNNGSIYLSVRDAASRMGVVDLQAASRAFDELIGLGFIEMTQNAHFEVKASEMSRARCWRLTWLVGPGQKVPTCEFLKQEPPPQTRERKRMERGQRALKAFRRARDSGRLPVLDSNTPIPENAAFQPKLRVRDSATHTAATIGSNSGTAVVGWWEPDWTRAAGNLAFALTLAAHAGLNSPSPKQAV